MDNLILFPFGGNAREALIAIEAQNSIKPTWNLIGFIDDDETLWGKKYYGLEVIGGKKILSSYPSIKVLAVPGNPVTYLEREKNISMLDVPSNQLATVVDPTAKIAQDATVGKNTLIMANVFISCSVRIGNHCIILPNTVVSHDSVIEDYTIVGSNVSISGSCHIFQQCYIGTGTKIKNNIVIGYKTLVGIGSCVTNDLPSEVTVAGNPARMLRDGNL